MDGPAGALGLELLELMKLVFEYWDGFKNGQLSRIELQTWMAPVQRQVEELLHRGKMAGIDRLSGSSATLSA